MRIKLTSIMVEDQDKALRFYTDVLGFVKKNDISMGEFRWLTVASPEGPEGIELVLEPMGYPFARTYQAELFKNGIPLTAFAADPGAVFQARAASMVAEGLALVVDAVEAALGSTGGSVTSSAGRVALTIGPTGRRVVLGWTPGAGTVDVTLTASGLHGVGTVTGGATISATGIDAIEWARRGQELFCLGRAGRRVKRSATFVDLDVLDALDVSQGDEDLVPAGARRDAGAQLQRDLFPGGLGFQVPTHRGAAGKSEHLQARVGGHGLADFLIGEDSWRIRYLLVDTSNWIGGKSVIVSSETLERVDKDDGRLYVAADRDTIATAPARPTAPNAG